MRRVVRILVWIGLLWAGLGRGLVLADGMILPGNAGTGYLVVRYHHVTVRIRDGHAVTQVEQMFYNPHPFAVRARYLFPIPPEAMFSGFQASVDGQPQSAERQDVAATNAALYDAVIQRRDPSLLQYVDWESLAFDLDLPAGGSRKMTLAYEQVLAPSGGLYHYRYVLSTEQYSSQPLQEVSIVVDLESSAGLSSVYSSSHAATTELLGPGRARVQWQARDVQPNEDFDLFFAPSQNGFGGGFVTGQRNQEDHFLFLFSPAESSQQAESMPKDIVFILDRSGSMQGDKIEQARNALQFILGQLDGDDRFSIVGFNDGRSLLAETLLTADADSLAGARRYVDQLQAGGATDLEAALQEGLHILSRSKQRDAPRLVVFLTDGLPTAGVRDEDQIARLVGKANGRVEARLHVFGVGYDVNTHLLDRLAADNGGSVTYVQPGENLELVLTGFYAQIAHPVLTDVEVEFEGIRVSDLYPEAVPDLFQGSTLMLVGRYLTTDEAVTVHVRGRAGNERREYTYSFELERAPHQDFVPRLWATRRLGALLDRVRVQGASRSLVSQIRDLGLSYGLVTPYTTFVIEGQAEGPASTANNMLYQRGDLNWVSGETTIQARVQNLAYQQAAQANLATGANVIHRGQHSLAQIGNQQVDLALLQAGPEPDAAIDEDWVVRNLRVQRTVSFGSAEYLALAADPEARSFLQSGRNVMFNLRGNVIWVQDGQGSGPGPDAQESSITEPLAELEVQADQRDNSTVNSPAGVRHVLSGCCGLYALAALLGVTLVVAKHIPKNQ